MDLAGALEAVEAGALPAVEAGLGAIATDKSKGWGEVKVGRWVVGDDEDCGTFGRWGMSV